MKTWEEIKSVDDLITKSEKEIIKEIEEKLIVRCPYLKKVGDFFYYCSGGIPEDTKLKLEPRNPIICAKEGVAQLQLHCMDRYKACCHYQGTLPFPGLNLSARHFA